MMRYQIALVALLVVMFASCVTPGEATSDGGRVLLKKKGSIKDTLLLAKATEETPGRKLMTRSRIKTDSVSLGRRDSPWATQTVEASADDGARRKLIQRGRNQAVATDASADGGARRKLAAARPIRRTDDESTNDGARRKLEATRPIRRTEEGFANDGAMRKLEAARPIRRTEEGSADSGARHLLVNCFDPVYRNTNACRIRKVPL